MHHPCHSTRKQNGERSDSIESESSEFSASMASIRSKVEKLTRSREQGTLHHQQCIDELSSQFDARMVRVEGAPHDEPATAALVSPTRSETPTSFVTVIEVKDPTPASAPSAVQPPTATSIAIAGSASPDDMKPEPSYSAPQLPHKQEPTGDECPAAAAAPPALVRCDDSSAAQSSHVIEVKRKIPPR